MMYSPFAQAYELRRHPANPNLVAGIQLVVPAGSSIIDIGAGMGVYVDALRSLGYVANGIDGTRKIESITKGLVKRANLISEVDCAPFFHSAQWGLFSDVGEHVPPEHEDVLLDNVSRMPTDGLIVNWGSVGQRGRGHVNCHSSAYVANRFALRGWLVDEGLTTKLRARAGFCFRSRSIVMKRGTKPVAE